MSTLDDALLEKAKEIAVGRVSEVVEEKRIKPTVIRRRKVQVVVQRRPQRNPQSLKKPRRSPKQRRPLKKSEPRWWLSLRRRK